MPYGFMTQRRRGREGVLKTPSTRKPESHPPCVRGILCAPQPLLCCCYAARQRQHARKATENASCDRIDPIGSTGRFGLQVLPVRLERRVVSDSQLSQSSADSFAVYLGAEMAGGWNKSSKPRSDGCIAGNLISWYGPDSFAKCVWPWLAWPLTATVPCSVQSHVQHRPCTSPGRRSLVWSRCSSIFVRLPPKGSVEGTGILESLTPNTRGRK
jgi:hypothetical protein